jgi:glycosyltransferase involved in cell wall biosynthesis
VYDLPGTLQRFGSLYSEAERRHAPPFPDPELTWNLDRVVRAFRPDVVHAHNWLLRSYLPLRAIHRTPLVITLHSYAGLCAKSVLLRGGEVCPGPSPSRCLPCASTHFGLAKGVVTYAANALAGPFERWSADHLIAVSRAVAERYGLPAGRVPYDVLPTLIPDDAGTLAPAEDPRLAALPPDGYLLFVGDLTRYKGVEVLLAAYAALNAPPPLVMIGRRCPDMPSELPPGVHVFESWPHAAVMHAWSRCLFGIAPSVLAEPCGTIVMEAHAVGKPMVVSGHGGLADLVADGETGLHVPPGDAMALAGAMSALLDSADRRAAMGAAAKVRSEIFMAKTITPRIEAIYEAVTARGRADAPCLTSLSS